MVLAADMFADGVLKRHSRMKPQLTVDEPSRRGEREGAVKDC